MDADDELCLCFHITRRKVANYIRIERPRRAAQLSECYGAGTGCGWCRPFLERMFTAATTKDLTKDLTKETLKATSSNATENTAGNNEVCEVDLPSAADYARERGNYVRSGGGTPPPGATPPAAEG